MIRLLDVLLLAGVTILGASIITAPPIGTIDGRLLVAIAATIALALRGTIGRNPS